MDEMDESMDIVPEDAPVETLELADDGAEQVTEDAPDVPEDVPEDVPVETLELADDGAEQVMEDTPDVPEDVPEDVPVETLELADDGAEQVTEDAPEVPEDVPGDAPQETPEILDNAETSPDDMPYAPEVTETELTDRQKEQLADLGEGYQNEAGIHENIIQDSLNSDTLSTEEKRGGLEFERGELERIQGEYEQHAQEIRNGAADNDLPKVLRLDPEERLDVELRGLDNVMDARRDDLSDKGCAPEEMEGILSQERQHEEREIRQRILGETGNEDLPGAAEASSAVDSAFNAEHDVIEVPRTSDIDREILDIFPESRQKAIDTAYADAPKEITEAINACKENLNYVKDSGYSMNNDGEWVKDGSYYIDGSDTITMNERMNDAEYSEVFQHEVGHFVDCQRGWESHSQEFTDAMEADLRSMDTSTPEGRMRVNDMLDDAFSTGAAYDRNVSDSISALFRNDPAILSRFCDEGAAYYRHSNDYWARDNNRQSEVYANNFGIQSAQHRISKNFMERYFPSTNETFLRMLSQKR